MCTKFHFEYHFFPTQVCVAIRRILGRIGIVFEGQARYPTFLNMVDGPQSLEDCGKTITTTELEFPQFLWKYTDSPHLDVPN